MAKRSTKFYRRNEKEVMESLGLKQTKNSGSTWIEKGDGQNDKILCELKSTDKESIRVYRFDLNQAEYHAFVANKIPMFAIQFIVNNETWLLVKPTDLYDLANALQNKKQKPKQQLEPITESEVEKPKKQVKKITSSVNAKVDFQNEQRKKYDKTKKAN